MHGPSVSLTRFLNFYVEVGCKLTAHFTSLSSPLFSTSLFNLLIACYNTCSKETESLFGKAPAPAPPAAPAGTLTNTLEVERLHTVACEKVEQQLCHEKVAPVEPQKTAPPAPAPAPPFLQGAGALPNRPSIFHINYQQRSLLVKII